MPRRLRLWVPDGIYHLTVRGNNREPLFFDDADFQQYLLEVRQARDAEPYHLLAFALMPNHVHLVVQSQVEGSLSRMMQRTATAYARYFNARYGHIGHVYQGRFYSNLVSRDSYFLEVTRYVHLNPVRAGLARRPADYSWSSYRSYVGLEENYAGWIEPKRIWEFFGKTEGDQIARYKQFVEQLVDQEMIFAQLVRRLQRNKLIPPRRWLTPKVSDTFPASKSV